METNDSMMENLIGMSACVCVCVCVCVCAFDLCETSVKVGCFGLAPLALVNSVYLALWCVFRCLIKFLVLNKVISFPPLDTVEIGRAHFALLRSSSFILK